MNKKALIPRFFLIYASFATVSNFVHPVTPMFLQSINCPDFMFGAAFAMMAFTNFLCSSFFGKLGDRYGYTPFMAFGLLGYSFAQYLFSLATGSWMVIFARLVSGVFLAALNVNNMAYLVGLTETREQQGKCLAIYAMIMSICGAAGYFIGGMLGDYGVHRTFMVQVFGLALLGLLVPILLREERHERPAEPLRLSEVNPISTIYTSFRSVDKLMGVFLVTVFLAAFATYAHDNSFNYYLRAQLDFPPSGNGMFKAAVALISLFANSTITTWLTKHTDTRRSVIYVLAAAGGSLALMLLVPGVPLFLATALFYYIFAAVYVPLQQVLAMQDDDDAAGESKKGNAAGLYNASRSLGMMAGPLVSGFAYSLYSKLPFIIASATFLLSAVLSWRCYRTYRSRKASAAEN